MKFLHSDFLLCLPDVRSMSGQVGTTRFIRDPTVSGPDATFILRIVCTLGLGLIDCRQRHLKGCSLSVPYSTHVVITCSVVRNTDIVRPVDEHNKGRVCRKVCRCSLASFYLHTRSVGSRSVVDSVAGREWARSLLAGGVRIYVICNWQFHKNFT